MENNQLTHWGVKGMRWGVRKDRDSGGGGTKRVSRKVRKQREANLKKAREAREAKAAEAKDIAERRAKALKSTDASEILKNKDLLTTAEINERLSRIDAERRLSEASARSKKTGMEYIDKALKIGRKINEVYEFTNTPVMKVAKKKLGLDVPEPKRMSLKEVYNKRNSLSDKALTDALKRATTEKAIKKILDELDAANAKPVEEDEDKDK